MKLSHERNLPTSEIGFLPKLSSSVGEHVPAWDQKAKPKSGLFTCWKLCTGEILKMFSKAVVSFRSGSGLFSHKMETRIPLPWSQMLLLRSPTKTPAESRVDTLRPTPHSPVAGRGKILWIALSVIERRSHPTGPCLTHLWTQWIFFHLRLI